MFLGYIDPSCGFTLFTLGSWLIMFLAGFLGVFLLFFKKIINFFKKGRKIIFILTPIFLSIIILGVMMIPKKSEFHNRVIVLGFDGLDPNIIEPMMEQGNLPNFVKLKEKGSYRHLATTNPAQSPVAWTGFATGQNPGKNGVFDFIVRDPQTYGLSLSVSDNSSGLSKRVVKSKCFWQYASQKNVPAVIIACPLTFPPDKIQGRMLSGMGVPDILGTEGTFTFYTTEPLDRDKDVGGKVFNIHKSEMMVMNLIGPRVATVGGKAENIKVPVSVVSLKGKDSIVIEFQNNKFELKRKEWSDWKEVTFNIGLFKKMRGILKFYLVQIEPEFKLYISPINFDPRRPFFKISYPVDYSKSLADSIGLYYTQGMPFQTWAVKEKRLTEASFLEQVDEVLKEKKAILDLELNRFEKGILFCYFGSSDIIQHMFWHYTDKEHPFYNEEDPGEYKKIIEKWYKQMDTVLGDVWEKLRKEDTLIVLSDHGFGSFRRAIHINSWLRKNGYLELKNPQAKSGSELLTDVDWLKTRAYAVGFGAIYINLKGREKKGIVNPGADAEFLKQELADKLKQWVDEKDNNVIINDVYKREEIFWGGQTNRTPDLYVGFNIGYRASWQTALGSVPDKLIEDNLTNWSGDHIFDPKLIPGVLFLNRQINKENPAIYDITPTILKIIGYSDEKIKTLNFDGEPLF